MNPDFSQNLKILKIPFSLDKPIIHLNIPGIESAFITDKMAPGEIFQSHKIKEFLWGYEVKSLSNINNIFTMFSPFSISDNWGILADLKNGTTLSATTIRQGKDAEGEADFENQTYLLRINGGQSNANCWSDPALNSFEDSTDGLGFPPFSLRYRNQARVFRSDFFTTLNYQESHREYMHSGLLNLKILKPTLRYTQENFAQNFPEIENPEQFLQNNSKNLDNNPDFDPYFSFDKNLFCEHSYKFMENFGMQEMLREYCNSEIYFYQGTNACKKANIPLAYSWPKFLRSNIDKSKLALNDTHGNFLFKSGLNANHPDYGSYVGVEPTTGVVWKMYKRFQVNAALNYKMKHLLPSLTNLHKNFRYLPILWIDANYELDFLVNDKPVPVLIWVINNVIPILWGILLVIALICFAIPTYERGQKRRQKLNTILKKQKQATEELMRSFKPDDDVEETKIPLELEF